MKEDLNEKEVNDVERKGIWGNIETVIILISTVFVYVLWFIPAAYGFVLCIIEYPTPISIIMGILFCIAIQAHNTKEVNDAYRKGICGKIKIVIILISLAFSYVFCFLHAMATFIFLIHILPTPITIIMFFLFGIGIKSLEEK